jgi:hypothetical protein
LRYIVIMSVGNILAAAAANPAAQLAEVSSTLFHDLDVAGELDLRPVTFHVPSDPKYKEVIDDLLRSMGHDPNAPAGFVVYVLRRYPHITVQLGALHGLTLSATGPGSFRLT